MWRTSMSILVSGWILFTPAIWHHRPEQAVLAVLVGLLCFVLSPVAAFSPRAARAIFYLGAFRALSTFALPDDFITNVDQLSTGLLLIIAAMYPRMKVVTAEAAATPHAHEPHQPRSRMAA
jgi:hypothetical protein